MHNCFSILHFIFILFLNVSCNVKDTHGTKPSGRSSTNQSNAECKGSGFTELWITKGSGNKIKVHATLKPVSLTWYEAAGCCMKLGLHLTNINNEKDLQAYFNLTGGQLQGGWSDVHGYSDDWRNLKGVFPSGDIYWGGSKDPAQPGRCLNISPRRHDLSHYFLYNYYCASVIYAVLYCEEDDPAYPKFDYNCDSLANKSSVTSGEMSAFETILKFNYNCEKQLPPRRMCKGVGFREKTVIKGSGNTVKVLESEAYVPANWFEAATCCKKLGLHLTNINNEGDLKGYYNLRGGDWNIGWSDVHGYSEDWRNLKGVYPSGDIFAEGGKPTVSKGQCKDIGVKRNGNTFFLFNYPCDKAQTEIIYCEEDDPADQKYNYNCDSLVSEEDLLSRKISPQIYYESVLKYNYNCDKHLPVRKVCNGVGFKKINITKGSGNTITVFASERPVPANWFEAAFCCKRFGLHLTNINNAGDLLAYHKLRAGDGYIGWADVHGYSDDWRNLKGVYLSGNIFAEGKKSPVAKGQCREIGNHHRTDNFSLFLQPCSKTITEDMYCEESDPAVAEHNYNCDSIIPETDLFTGAILMLTAEIYYINILRYKHDCEKHLPVRKVCYGVGFEEKYLTKGSGNTIKVLVSERPVTANWFEAAACCKKFGLHLTNINNAGDLQGYHNLRGGDINIGWSDVHGYSDDWRNLKGIYLSADTFSEGRKPALVKGQCRQIGNAAKFYLYPLPCDQSITKDLYCEENDPANSEYNYNCDSVVSEADLTTAKVTPQGYFENVLKLNSNCEKKPPTPPKERHCHGVFLNETSITKGSGNTIKVFYTKSYIPLTWFQAAACCKRMGLNLANINNEGDLKGYFDSKLGEYHIGWSDVHGFGKDWRNLKGVYPKGDIWHEQNRKAVQSGQCKEIGPRNWAKPEKYYLVEHPCTFVHTELLFCEEDDPAVPEFNYNCDLLVSEKSMRDDSRVYFETVLKDNPHCDRPPTVPTTTSKTTATTTTEKLDVTITTPENLATTTTESSILTLVPVVNSSIPVLTPCIIYVSKKKASWDNAIKGCKDQNMILLVIPTEEDNQFLNNVEILKYRPYSAATRFWSGAKFASTNYEKEILKWESWNKTFPNHKLNRANGITKWWGLGEPFDGAGKGTQLCIDMKFPGNSPPVWFASDCASKYYYICVENPDERDPTELCKEDSYEEGENVAGGQTTIATTTANAEYEYEGENYNCTEITTELYPFTEETTTLSTTTNTTEPPSVEIEGTFYPDPAEYPNASNTTGIKSNNSNIIKPTNLVKCESWTGLWIPKMTNPFNMFQIQQGTLDPYSYTHDPEHPCKEMVFWKNLNLPGLFIPDNNANWPIHGGITQGEYPIIFTATDPNKAILQITIGTWIPEPSYNILSYIHGTMKPNVELNNTGTSEFVPDEFILGIFTIGLMEMPGKLTQGRPQLFYPIAPPNVNTTTTGIWKPTAGLVPNHPFTSIRGILAPWENDAKYAVFTPDKEIPVQFVPDLKLPSALSNDTATAPVNGTATQNNPPVFKPSPNPFKTCEKISGTFKSLANPTDWFHGVLAPVNNCTGDKPQVFQISTDNTTSGVFVPDSKTRGIGDNGINGTLTENENMPIIFTTFSDLDTLNISKKVIYGTFKPYYHGHNLHGHLELTSYGYYIFILDTKPPGHFIINEGDRLNHIIKGNLSRRPPHEFSPVDKTEVPFVSTHVVWIPDDPKDPDNPFGNEETQGILQPSEDLLHSEKDDIFIFIPDDSVQGQIVVDGQPPQIIHGSLTQIKNNTSQNKSYVFTPATAGDIPPRNFTQSITGMWDKSPPTSSKYPYSALHGTFDPDPGNPNLLIFTPDSTIVGEFSTDDGEVIPGTMTQSVPIVFTSKSPVNINKHTHGFWKPSVGFPPTAPFIGVVGTLKTYPGNNSVIIFEPDVEVVVTIVQLETSMESTAIMVQGNPPIIKPSKPVNDDSQFPVMITSQKLPVFGILDPIASLFPRGNSTNKTYVFIEFSWVRMEFYPALSSSEQKFFGTFSQGSKPIVKPDHNKPMKVVIKGTMRPITESLNNHPLKSEFYMEPIHGELKPISSMPENHMIFIPYEKVPGEMIFTYEKDRSPAPGNLQPDKANPMTRPAIFIPNPSWTIGYKIDVAWKPKEIDATGQNGIFGVVTFGKLIPSPSNVHTFFFFAFPKIRGQFIPESTNLNPINGSMINSSPPTFVPDNKNQTINAETSGMWKPEVEDEDAPFGSPQLGVMKSTEFEYIGILIVWVQLTIAPDQGCDGRFYPDSNFTNSIHGHIIKPSNFIVTNSDENFKENTPGNWVPNPDADPANPFSEPAHGVMKPEGGDIVWVPDSAEVCNKQFDVTLVC